MITSRAAAMPFPLPDESQSLWDQELYPVPSFLRRLCARHGSLMVAAQLVGTLLGLVLLPSSLAKAIVLPAWWALTFGAVTVFEGALFVTASVVFTAMNALALRQGVFAFASTDVLGMPWFEPLMWGFYLLHTRRVLRAIPAPTVDRRGLAVLGAAAFAVVFSSAAGDLSRFAGPALVIATAAIWFHSRSDLAHMGYMVLLGALIEYAGVWTGQWSYPTSPAGGVPAWFITMWAGVGLFAIRLFPARDASADGGVESAGRVAPDILLVNSFNPRRRSLSDTFLDNGLAILRTALENAGHVVEVEDSTGIGELEKFTPAAISRPLRAITLRLLAAREQERPARMLKLAFVTLQHVLDAVHAFRSHRYIRRIARHVRDTGVPVVGIKVWYGRSFVWSKRLTAELKRRCPETIVVAGGPHANLYNQNGAILAFSNFDLAVYSEGERTLLAIMECVRAGRDRAERLALIHGRNMANLIWRDGARVVVNPIERPCPDAKPVPTYSGLTGGRVLVHTLVDGLGCDYNRCTFCAHKNIYHGYRKRSLEPILDEMQTLIDSGVAVFRFASGDTPRCHAIAIANGILARGLTVEFSMFHRATRNALDKFDSLVEDYRLMIRAGLRSVFMGLETGDDRTNREILGKSLCRADVIWSVRAVQKARSLEQKPCDIALSCIHPVPSFPGVTWDELRGATLDVIREAHPDSVLVTPPCAFPGTDWFDRPAHYGFHLGENFVERLMNYEYCVYKPTDLWTGGEFALNGRPTRDLLAETMKLRFAVEKMGIETDLGDENFLLLQAAREPAARFKRESLADILSCDYRYSHQLYTALNGRSTVLALCNGVPAPDAQGDIDIGGRAARASTDVPVRQLEVLS